MRPTLILPVLVIAAMGLANLASCNTPESPGLLVSLANSSSQPLEGLTLSTDDVTKTVPVIPAGGSVQIRPYSSPGENSLILSDAEGHRYVLLGYFEGTPKGRVEVALTGRSGGVLQGRVKAATDYPGTDGNRELRPAAR